MTIGLSLGTLLLALAFVACGGGEPTNTVEADYEAAAVRVIERQLDNMERFNVWLEEDEPFLDPAIGSELQSLAVEWDLLGDLQAAVQPAPGMQATHTLWSEATGEMSLAYDGWLQAAQASGSFLDTLDVNSLTAAFAQIGDHKERAFELFDQVSDAFGLTAALGATPTAGNGDGN